MKCFLLIVLSAATCLIFGLLVSPRLRARAAALKDRLCAAWQRATTEEVVEWVEREAQPAKVNESILIGCHVGRAGIHLVQRTTPEQPEVRGRTVRVGFLLAAARNARRLFSR